MRVSYKLTLPFTSVLEKQIHTCHPDMKYATLDWIPSAFCMLRERKIANPVGHLYFFSRWYGHKQVEKILLFRSHYWRSLDNNRLVIEYQSCLFEKF